MPAHHLHHQGTEVDPRHHLPTALPQRRERVRFGGRPQRGGV
jgi:hypothetical protein